MTGYQRKIQKLLQTEKRWLHRTQQSTGRKTWSEKAISHFRNICYLPKTHSVSQRGIHLRKLKVILTTNSVTF